MSDSEKETVTDVTIQPLSTYDYKRGDSLTIEGQVPVTHNDANLEFIEIQISSDDVTYENVDLWDTTYGSFSQTLTIDKEPGEHIVTVIAFYDNGETLLKEFTITLQANPEIIVSFLGEKSRSPGIYEYEYEFEDMTAFDKSILPLIICGNTNYQSIDWSTIEEGVKASGSIDTSVLGSDGAVDCYMKAYDTNGGEVRSDTFTIGASQEGNVEVRVVSPTEDHLEESGTLKIEGIVVSSTDIGLERVDADISSDYFGPETETVTSSAMEGETFVYDMDVSDYPYGDYNFQLTAYYRDSEGKTGYAVSDEIPVTIYNEDGETLPGLQSITVNNAELSDGVLTVDVIAPAEYNGVSISSVGLYSNIDPEIPGSGIAYLVGLGGKILATNDVDSSDFVCPGPSFTGAFTGMQTAGSSEQDCENEVVNEVLEVDVSGMSDDDTIFAGGTYGIMTASETVGKLGDIDETSTAFMWEDTISTADSISKTYAKTVENNLESQGRTIFTDLPFFMDWLTGSSSSFIGYYAEDETTNVPVYVSVPNLGNEIMKAVYDAADTANQNDCDVSISPLQVYGVMKSEGAGYIEVSKYRPEPARVPFFETFGETPDKEIIGTEVGLTFVGTNNYINKLKAGNYIPSNLEVRDYPDYQELTGQSPPRLKAKDAFTYLAGVLAYKKCLFHRDFKELYGEDELKKLTPDEESFWLTFYYWGEKTAENALENRDQNYVMIWEGNAPSRDKDGDIVYGSYISRYRTDFEHYLQALGLFYPVFPTDKS